MSGLRIKQYREISKYSQKDLANILGVSTRSVARWEQNDSKPHPDEIKRITTLLGITEEELLRDDDEDIRSSTYKPKQDVLDRISDSVDNLVTGQETINESLLSNRDEYIRKQDEVISELRSQNKSLLLQISSYKKELDDSRTVLHHKWIRTIIIGITCLIIIALILISWFYWWNYGIHGELDEGSVDEGTPSYFEIDDGQ